jgi:hypothetical protein
MSARAGRGAASRRFRDNRREAWDFQVMATPNAAKSLEMTTQAGLEDELRRAEQDFVRGDFIELTVEQLDQCIEAGEWPWASESSE